MTARCARTSPIPSHAGQRRSGVQELLRRLANIEPFPWAEGHILRVRHSLALLTRVESAALAALVFVTLVLLSVLLLRAFVPAPLPHPCHTPPSIRSLAT